MLSSRHSMHSAIAKQVTRWVQTHCQNSITRSEMKVKRFASLFQRSMLHLHSLPRTENREYQKTTSRRRHRTMLQETTSKKRRRTMFQETMSRKRRRTMLQETTSKRIIIRKLNSQTSRRQHRQLQHSPLYSLQFRLVRSQLLKSKKQGVISCWNLYVSGSNISLIRD